MVLNSYNMYVFGLFLYYSIHPLEHKLPLNVWGRASVRHSTRSSRICLDTFRWNSCSRAFRLRSACVLLVYRNSKETCLSPRLPAGPHFLAITYFRESSFQNLGRHNQLVNRVIVSVTTYNTSMNQQFVPGLQHLPNTPEVQRASGQGTPIRVYRLVFAYYRSRLLLTNYNNNNNCVDLNVFVVFLH